MIHTEEDLKGFDLFAHEEEKQPVDDFAQKCNTALEILQNELINCERNISLEKSAREKNEKKIEYAGESKEIKSKVTADDIPNIESINHDESINLDIFSNDQYCEIIENILRVGNHFNGIKENDMQKIIFEYAELNEINHGFDAISRRTGNEWYRRFIQLHPQLNSALKKSNQECTQLDETDTTRSSRIVDQFLYNYRNSEECESKTEKSIQREELGNEKYFDVAPKNEKILKLESSFSSQKSDQKCLNGSAVSTSCVVDDTETLKRNESDDFHDEKTTSIVEAVSENISETAINSKQTFSNTLARNLKNEEFFDAVSCVCSNNTHSVGEKCYTEKNYFGNDENTPNESNKISNVSFENVAEVKNNDGCSVFEVNSTHLKTDVLSIATYDSGEIPVEKSLVTTENDHTLGEKTNTLIGLDSSCSEALNIISTEATESCTTTDKNDDITPADHKANDESNDIENLSHNGVVLSENASGLSGLKTTHLEADHVTLDNLEKKESLDENSSSVNFNKCHENEANNSTDPSVDTDTVTGENNSDETTSMNTPKPAVRSPSKRKHTDTLTGPESEGDEKKPKISKKTRPSSKTKKKKVRYLYKLKSYTGSVLYFKSSTSVSFIRPVIKLTKLDESLCKNSDSITASSPNATAPPPSPEVNHIDEGETDANAGSDTKDQVEAEPNSSTGFEMKNQTTQTCTNTPRYSLRCASKRKESDVSTGPESKRDEKKPKISKKAESPSNTKTKKVKYLYTLQSLTGSILYFASSTTVSFIKPVIKLTRLDESLY